MRRPRFVIHEPVEAPKATCPYCAADLDAATGVTGERQPSGGDWSLCSYCAGLLVFRDDLTVREPDVKELQAMLRNPELMTAQAALRHIHQKGTP